MCYVYNEKLYLKNVQMDIMEHAAICRVLLASLVLNVQVDVFQSALSKIVIVLVDVKMIMETLHKK